MATIRDSIATKWSGRPSTFDSVSTAVKLVWLKWAKVSILVIHSTDQTHGLMEANRLHSMNM